ncbi:hypothetical protein [Haliscomenobacter hydrossis]|uniref:DUF4304 domain-containing protein n=1 Tax=Haliscomenobacter hydrossis (strain ATCC 27775 / DSM 1100 / LMG 10767 / O) TaxID=760192 RepID=F4L3F6_HALH1|nr:hypothetical protein [Haliscomenobacter hydrossis]AEE52933.1 hypothetical protein Halhy_5107 [Haliscomenobacter hydrossis DSM 1100]
MEINRDPLSASLLRSQIDNRLTSYLKNLGLDKWNGAYYWYSDYGTHHYRKVFHYTLLKGESATFAWGYCFDFIPTYGNTNNLRWNRTEKSVRLHFWDMPANFVHFAGSRDAHRRSLRGRGLVSHWGETAFDVTFNELFEDSYAQIESWFKTDYSLEDLLNWVDLQIERSIDYPKSPHPNYVKCFLLAKLGRSAEAIDAMEKMKNLYCAHDHKWEPLFTQLVSIIKKTSP